MLLSFYCYSKDSTVLLQALFLTLLENNQTASKLLLSNQDIVNTPPESNVNVTV